MRIIRGAAGWAVRLPAGGWRQPFRLLFRITKAMTVVAFSLARFSPADLSEFNEIARPRMDRGLWAGVSRQTSPDGDQLLVTFPHLDRPVFRFERDRRGTYTLWFHDRQGWHSIGTGTSATECLSIWRTRPARVAPAAQAREAY
jgi:hypothetical protein